MTLILRFNEVSVVLVLCIICGLVQPSFSFGLKSMSLNPVVSRGPCEARDLSALEMPADTDSSERRLLLRNAVASAVVAISAVSFPSPSSSEGVSVLRSKGCYRGEGEACDELAEGNEFIQSLQKKSAENREMNDREALNAYNMKNFPDFFASLNPPKYLVKQPDGTFGVYTDAELADLKRMGKITVENPKAKGGKFMDLTQKPMLVLVE